MTTDDQAASIAASIDWTPTCLPGEEKQTIVRQILEAAATPAASEESDERNWLSAHRPDGVAPDPVTSEGARTPGWVRALRAKTGLALTPEPWGHWCCQAGAMADPGPCPWHPAASGDTVDRATAVVAGQLIDKIGHGREQMDTGYWMLESGAIVSALDAEGLLADGRDRARIEKALDLVEQWRVDGPDDSAIRIFGERIRAALTSPEEP